MRCGEIVHLEIEREALCEAIVVKESECRLGVEIVLVRGGLAWLGLEQQLPLEACSCGHGLAEELSEGIRRPRREIWGDHAPILSA